MKESFLLKNKFNQEILFIWNGSVNFRRRETRSDLPEIQRSVFVANQPYRLGLFCLLFAHSFKNKPVLF